jgi:hypothetical protein
MSGRQRHTDLVGTLSAAWQDVSRQGKNLLEWAM